MRHGISGSFFHALVGNGIAAILGAVALIIAIRGVSPESWAGTAIVIGLGPSLGLVLSLGSVAFQTRRMTRIADLAFRRTAYSLYLGRRLAITLPIVAVALVLLALGVEISGLVLLLAALRFFRGGTSVLLASTRRFGVISLLTGAEKAVVLLCVLLADTVDLLTWVTLPLAFIFSYVVFAGISFVLERPVISSRIFAIACRSPLRAWSGSSKFGVASLVGPVQQADVSILAAVSDTIQAGLLGAGSRLTNALNLPGGSLATIILPYFSATPGRPAITRKARLLVGTMMLAFLFCLLVAAMSTQVWVPIILGEDYSNASLVITFYLGIVGVQTFVQPMMALLQAWDNELVVMWLSVYQILGIVLVTALMGFYWGATGAALGQLLIAVSTAIVLFGLLLRANSKRI